MEEKEVRITARVPRALKKLMQQFVALDSHINESDLIRDSIREKIQHDAPQLYSRLFDPKTKEQKELVEAAK
jgi:Arc/MetJ-type ribon-helix-helix transcriptional regulator